jgi:hypothetical protein
VRDAPLLDGLRPVARRNLGHREETVILDIPELLSELVPGLLDGGPVSVACVRATRPKYLVFGEDTDRPTCVVQFGPLEALEREHHVLSRLHPILPDLVAAPLALSAWSGSLFVQVQSGLPGSPWFRLADRVRSARAWKSLGLRALAALERLHEAVRVVPEWVGTIQPGEELRRQAAACRSNGPRLSAQVCNTIDAAVDLLDDLGARPHFWQHGDYCLNNLLVSRSRLAIIDFEEFGGTSMPWHDQIGLALSLDDLSPRGSWPLAAPLDTVAMPEYAGWPQPTDRDFFQGFVLHHLLWRINQAAGRPTRAPIQVALAKAVEQVTTGPAASRLVRVGR